MLADWNENVSVYCIGRTDSTSPSTNTGSVAVVPDTWFDGHFAPVLHPQGEHVGP